jgi:twitching motility protein PilT
MSLLDVAPIIEQMLLISDNVSDLNFSCGQKPQVEINGSLYSASPLGLGRLTGYQTEMIAMSIPRDNPEAASQLVKFGTADLSYALPGRCRFRVNIFQQRSSYSIVMRVIPHEIPSFASLNIPSHLADICNIRNGIVLLTGPTGSGKSSTLAAIIDHINETKSYHIVTIEDPIEFLHNHKNCVVNQREVASDTHSFGAALRTALRQDPDVVLVGEMRDLETIEMALRISETGHLTFATLHTNSAYSTINRIIDVFPAAQQAQVRTQLSLVLEGIMCQALLPKASGDGRVMALEILVPNSAIRNLIREDKIHQIYSMMQTGQDKFGMQTFNQALASLYQKRQITLETAMQRSSNADELKDLIDRGSGLNQSYTGGTKPAAPGGHASPYAQGRPVGSRPPVR